MSDGTNTATYSYLANSSLVGQITFSSNTTVRMTTTKQYDYLNRLTSISSDPSNSYAYLYNAANQRTMTRLADSSYWNYNYDSLGQVIQGNKYWVDETPVAGQQFDYTFDSIGNRVQTEAGGDQNGANLRVAYYTNNSLNQITGRTVPGYVDVMGIGIATNPVTVNGTTAYRKNEYFREQLSAANTSAAVWDSITITNGGTTNTGHLYVAETPELYTYDADGNLLSDGRWNYTWDGENRLLSMTSLSGAPSGSQVELNFTYDYMSRRVQKLVSTNNGSSYVGEYTNKYAYDQWNCLAVMSPTFALSNSFTWGLDLSGSPQGAGGVGGLLAENVAGNGVQFLAYDGNGNVSALVSASNGVTVANYEYGPLGELIRASGPVARLNPCRFSTKFDDDETDLLYYGYRYYNPSTGRWPSRDPIGERGGGNLYGFAGNTSLFYLDLLGLDRIIFTPANPVLLPVHIYPPSYLPSNPGQTVVTVPVPNPNDPDNGFLPANYTNITTQAPQNGMIFVPISNASDFNKRLKSVCGCIGNLAITGHGAGGTQVVGPSQQTDPTTTLFVNYPNGTATANNLQFFDGIKFCKPCSIILDGCSTATGVDWQDLFHAISQKTGCEVLGNTGLVNAGKNGPLPGGNSPIVGIR